MIYRKASSTDIIPIIRLTQAAYQDYEPVLTVQNWTKMAAGLAIESRYVDLMNQATAFVCEADGQLIGVIFLIPSGNPTRIFPADWSYIRLLGVLPAYRGLGVGKTLTELCIGQAKASGETAVALHTSEFMNQARIMYEQLGFKPVKELEPIFDKRYWLYKLSI